MTEAEDFGRALVEAIRGLAGAPERLVRRCVYHQMPLRHLECPLVDLHPTAGERDIERRMPGRRPLEWEVYDPVSDRVVAIVQGDWTVDWSEEAVLEDEASPRLVGRENDGVSRKLAAKIEAGHRQSKGPAWVRDRISTGPPRAVRRMGIGAGVPKRHAPRHRTPAVDDSTDQECVA